VSNGFLRNVRLKGRKERYLSADISAKCRYSETRQDLNNLSGTVINPEMVLAQVEKCGKIDKGIL